MSVWEPWVPAEGDRVRVRISGECRATLAYDTGRDGLLSEVFVDRLGHSPTEDGAVGEVIIVEQWFDSGDSAHDTHRFMVEFDEPVAVDVVDHPQTCHYFAACELIPLEATR